MSESISKVRAARCIGTNVMDKARLYISHGDKDRSKQALWMVCSKAG